jgi:hypothetical protein
MAKPLLHIHCINEQYCDYPVAVKIAMDDGSVQTYVLENKTDFQFRKVMESLDNITVGYRYEPKHGKRKNRIHLSHR